jgi:cyclase
MNDKSPNNKDGLFAGAHPLIFENAKHLRKNMTDAERLLWYYLKEGVDGFKFRRQHPLGVYIVDFYCHKGRLVIEIDGSIHNVVNVKENDAVRQQWLEEVGFIVLRFTNKEVLENVHVVLQKIRTQIINEINPSL